MKRLIFAAALVTSPTLILAQDFRPTDYSFTDGAAIKTLKVKAISKNRSVIIVSIANRADTPFNANYACTLFDAHDKIIGATNGAANAVPPQQEIASESISFDDLAVKATCRIESIVATR
ncbi:hypothetical protein [Agrobacterium sp. ST15.13.015]|uniref:hypothetical protein n=1 Tax=Agrobacterium sp. ST15.13.015 TaxID=3017319 RepID=UPI0022C1178B|nr:hypothetical protein [Agrobacterium sp. ST15.13.015]MCZ7501265.1 hypothetical protein [Rhizobium rhizogenes]